MGYPFDCITEFMFFETEMQPADLIMIPGGSHPQLMERAAALYHQGLAPLILPSGGQHFSKRKLLMGCTAASRDSSPESNLGL